MTFEKVNNETLKVTQKREFMLLKTLKIGHHPNYQGTLNVNPSNPADMDVKWKASK